MISLVHVVHWMKGNSTRTEAVATDKEGDDDVKGWLEGCVRKIWWFEVDQSWRQQIRRTTTPPIFSSGMLDILLIEWCYQGWKPFGSSTGSTGASSNPDTLGRARTMEKTHHWSRDAGNQWWWPWSLGMHDTTLQRPHDRDHWHLRMNSQEDIVLINVQLDLRSK